MDYAEELVLETSGTEPCEECKHYLSIDSPCKCIVYDSIDGVSYVNEFHDHQAEKHHYYKIRTLSTPFYAGVGL